MVASHLGACAHIFAVVFAKLNDVQSCAGFRSASNHHPVLFRVGVRLIRPSRRGVLREVHVKFSMSLDGRGGGGGGGISARNWFDVMFLEC